MKSFMAICDSAGGKVRYPGRLKAQGQGGTVESGAVTLAGLIVRLRL